MTSTPAPSTDGRPVTTVDAGAMPAASGERWALVVHTPMGDQRFIVDLTRDGGSLTGVSASDLETVGITDGTVSGPDLSWTVAATRPFPMKLKFALTEDGGRLTGTTKAGPFPRVPAEGERLDGTAVPAPAPMAPIGPGLAAPTEDALRAALGQGHVPAARLTGHRPGTFSWTGLLTTDRAAAMAFYRSLFGWDYLELPVAADHMFTIALQDGAQVAAIDTVAGGGAPRWTCYLSVPDVTAAVSSAASAGAATVIEPVRVPHPDGHIVGGVAELTDPQGCPIALWEPGEVIGTQIRDVPVSLTFAVLGSPDAESSMRFYAGVFGWHYREPAASSLLGGPDPGDPTGAIVPAGDGVPGWLPYFAVADVPGIVATAATLGATVIASREWETGALAVLADPQGGRFGVVSGSAADAPPAALAASTGRVPFAASYNAFSPDAVADPFTGFAGLRAEPPARNAIRMVMVSRHADVAEVVGNPARFSSSDPFPDVPPHLRDRMPDGYPWAHPALINNDPPAHTRIRRLTTAAFSARAIAAREPEIRSVAEQLVDGFAGRGRADLVAEFTVPMPITVIARILGLPVDVATIKGWTDGAFSLGIPGLDDVTRDRLALGQAGFYEVVTGQIEQRRTQPRDDLLTALVRAEADGEPALSTAEVRAVVSQLLIAGNETTTAFIGNIVHLLLNEHRWADLADADVDAVLEECLRLAGPIKGLPRRVAADTEIGGCPVAKDERLIVLFASANRDEGVFEDAAELRPGRPERQQSMAFGRGIHFCIGAPLARLEARVAVEILHWRLPGLRLAGAPPQRLAAFHYGLDRVGVEWGG